MMKLGEEGFELTVWWLDVVHLIYRFPRKKNQLKEFYKTCICIYKFYLKHYAYIELYTIIVPFDWTAIILSRPFETHWFGIQATSVTIDFGELRNPGSFFIGVIKIEDESILWTVDHITGPEDDHEPLANKLPDGL